MKFENKIWMAQSSTSQYLIPKMANRHGLIAGASGTGKTITLKVMAESFSALGVPVFLADVKGDLAGMCRPGVDSESMQKRIERFGIQNFTYEAFPTRFWDIFGKNGHPVRTTISEMGPTLLSRILNLTEVQAGVLQIVFRIADDKGLLLIDLKDLKSMLQYVGDNRADFTLNYGNISAQSVGAIQRAIIPLESAGGELFFGEPDLDIFDWMSQDSTGKGMINILHSADLINTPVIYATFLLWMLSELFEKLPEAGDLEKPKMVFFFDEAHLLFDNMPKVLIQKIEQVVKLIRSKGVGVYFITQSPSDIPDEVLAQLSNRVQHALRAYTPAEQKAVKTAAQTFRQNPAFDTTEAIMELGVGEALVSFLDEEGKPGIVERAFILPPQSLMGGIDETTRMSVIQSSALYQKYTIAVDRESAYEKLNVVRQQEEERKEQERQQELLQKEKEKAQAKKAAQKGKALERTVSRTANSAFSSIGRELGRSIARGILGSFKK